jgi:hypothetical protein
MWVGGQHHAPAAFTSGKDPVPIVQEAGWESEPVWIGAENLAPTEIRSPDLPARSESLYRLRHPGSYIQFVQWLKRLQPRQYSYLQWSDTGSLLLPERV